MRRRNYKSLDEYRIGYIIRRRRIECKMSQKELSRRTGYCNTYLSRIENGYEMPSLAAMVRIYGVLDLSMDMVFCLQEAADMGSLSMDGLGKENSGQNGRSQDSRSRESRGRDNRRLAVMRTVTMMPDSQIRLVTDMLNKMHALNRNMAAPILLEDAEDEI